MATYKGHNEDSSGNILLSIGNGMTATVETGSTASQAYTKGAYIFFNNRFCKATKAISSGATLTIGNNLSETSVGAELTSHLRSSDGKEFYFDVKDGSYGYYPSASKTASEFVPFGGSLPTLNIYYGGYNHVYGVLSADIVNKYKYIKLNATSAYGEWINVTSVGLSVDGTSSGNLTTTPREISSLNCQTKIGYSLNGQEYINYEVCLYN